MGQPEVEAFVRRLRDGGVVVAVSVEATGPGDDHEPARHLVPGQVRAGRVEHGQSVVLRIDDPQVAIRSELGKERLCELSRPAPLPANGAEVRPVRVEHPNLLRL